MKSLIPVVDKNKKLKKIIHRDKVLNVDKSIKLKNIPVVVMAGGKGTRMIPFTKVLPKPLLPINNSTVIESIFSNFKKYGCKKFFVTINYKAKLLKTYLKEIKSKSISYIFVTEKKPLGTAGSLFFIKDKIKTDFFLCNCDTLIDVNYSAIYNFHKNNKFDITLIAVIKNISIPYGVCHVDQKQSLLRVEEKPVKNFMVSTGSYVLSNKVFKLMNKNSKKIHMNDLINDAKKKGYKMGVYPIKSKLWQDTGNWKNYNKIFEKNFLA
jgi:NDP-sugar pyrophosphorylase family protein